MLSGPFACQRQLFHVFGRSRQCVHFREHWHPSTHSTLRVTYMSHKNTYRIFRCMSELFLLKAHTGLRLFQAWFIIENVLNYRNFSLLLFCIAWYTRLKYLFYQIFHRRKLLSTIQLVTATGRVGTANYSVSARTCMGLAQHSHKSTTSNHCVTSRSHYNCRAIFCSRSELFLLKLTYRMTAFSYMVHHWSHPKSWIFQCLFLSTVWDVCVQGCSIFSTDFLIDRCLFRPCSRSSQQQDVLEPPITLSARRHA